MCVLGLRRRGRGRRRANATEFSRLAGSSPAISPGRTGLLPVCGPGRPINAYNLTPVEMPFGGSSGSGANDSRAGTTSSQS